MIIGLIDGVDSEFVGGWIYSAIPGIQPILLIDGQPMTLVDYPNARPDVEESLKIKQNTGFRFRIGRANPKGHMRLCGLVNGKLLLIDERTSSEAYAQRYSDLNAAIRLKKVSEQPDAIAITCWDGGHNPIGRAKTLYDIASTKHPVILVSYLFPEFGGVLWEPIATNTIEAFLIPWRRRALFHEMLAALGVRFDTIWICKPRLPSFQLSALLSKSGTRLIIDLDDNDFHMSASAGSHRKSYGGGGIGLAKALLARVSARTVASKSLQAQYGGELVRHARRTAHGMLPLNEREVRKVAFVGTARPHKNLPALARAIRIHAFRHGIPIEFHVLGDIQPASLREELSSAGAVVGGVIAEQHLQQEIAKYDVLTTGFIPQTPEQRQISDLQISAKIGDALAVGRPILVPRSPSVEDLTDIPGVCLFDEFDFDQALTRALAHRDPLRLPQEFTLEGAYDRFSRALRKSSSAPRAKAVFAHLLPAIEEQTQESPHTLLLIWKQFDAGIYGRRVDQIARAYRTACPGHNVVVLTMVHEENIKGLTDRADDYFTDAALLVGSLNDMRKRRKKSSDGVQYDVIYFRADRHVEEELLNYIVEKSYMPSDTTVILFPVIPHIDAIRNVFSHYRVIVDVVDNQFSWASSGDQVAKLTVYYAGVIGIASRIVFNSSENEAEFRSRGLLSGTGDGVVYKIENWYQTPVGFDPPKRESLGFNIFYSGNLNDRIDLPLVEEVMNAIPTATLHICGVADRKTDELTRLLGGDNVVYYGPRAEIDTLNLLSQMDVAIVPHAIDNVSRYMNPLKVRMYAALGVYCVATNVPGVMPVSGVTYVAENSVDFISAVREAEKRLKTTRKRAASPRREDFTEARRYIALIADLQESLRAVEIGDEKRARTRRGRVIRVRSDGGSVGSVRT